MLSSLVSSVYCPICPVVSGLFAFRQMALTHFLHCHPNMAASACDYRGNGKSSSRRKSGVLLGDAVSFNDRHPSFGRLIFCRPINIRIATNSSHHSPPLYSILTKSLCIMSMSHRRRSGLASWATVVAHLHRISYTLHSVSNRVNLHFLRFLSARLRATSWSFRAELLGQTPTSLYHDHYDNWQCSPRNLLNLFSNEYLSVVLPAMICMQNISSL